MSNATRNPLEIYQLLPKTNCGKCILPSCLAFAAAVAAGRKKLRDCSDLAPDVVAAFSGQCQAESPEEMEQAEFLEKLRYKIAALDFHHAAPLIGAAVQGDKLAVNSMGRSFQIDKQGSVTSECHIIPWVEAPLLSYVANPTHGGITGRWISFREIKGGIEWQGLFTSRCENPLRKLADDNPHLLQDIIDLFAGRTIDWYEADIALVLHPLPHLPLLICYQAPEEELESALTIFFDECCRENLHIKSLYTLCAGLVRMFTAIAHSHHR